MKAILVFIVSAFLASFIISDYGEYCNSRKILDRESITKADNRKYDNITLNRMDLFYDDNKVVYNKHRSCESLRSSDTDRPNCCYIKIKNKNEYSDKKYTHEGCIEMALERDGTELDVDDTIDYLEEYFTDNMTEAKKEVSDVKINIDCGSKFLQIASIALIALLL